MEKLRLQNLHTYGCSRKKKERKAEIQVEEKKDRNLSVCVRRCRVRFALLGKVFEQYEQQYRSRLFRLTIGDESFFSDINEFVVGGLDDDNDELGVNG